MLNKEVEDEYFLKDAKPYIYWQGQYWFIAHWTTPEKAEDACPEGYHVARYFSVHQKP